MTFFLTARRHIHCHGAAAYALYVRPRSKHQTYTVLTYSLAYAMTLAMAKTLSWRGKEWHKLLRNAGKPVSCIGLHTGFAQPSGFPAADRVVVHAILSSATCGSVDTYQTDAE